MGKIDMADHTPGEMDISEQKRTFEGFIKYGIWLSVVVALLLVLLAIVGI